MMTSYVHKYGVHKCTIDKVPNSGLKIQKSAIFGAYLPNLEALWHGFVFVLHELLVGRSGSFGSTKLVNKF